MARQFFNLAEVMGQVDNARAREQQLKANEFEMQRQARKYAEEDAQKSAYRDSIETTDGASRLNETKLLERLYQVNPEMGIKLQQQIQERDINANKAKNDNRSSDLKYQMDLSKYAGDVMAGATPQSWGIIKQDLVSKGVKAAEAMPDSFDADFQGKFLMNAESFLKQSGVGAGEDNLVIPTPNGLMYFNKKNKKDFGYIEKDGGRIMRSQDDPNLAGSIQGAKSRASGDYKINTDIDGTAATDTQVADFVRGGIPPSVVTPSNMQVPPNVQGARDDKRLQILMQEQANVGGAGKDKYLDAEIAAMTKKRPMVGVSVPTKADEAAAVQTAKDEAEYKSIKPLPAVALKMQNDGLDKLSIASNNNKKLLDIKKQIEDGKLNLGLASNITGNVRNTLGLSNESSRNLSSFKSTLEKLRNDSLRLNTGVQTDGDAQRAWNELFENINDSELVKQRLGEIAEINNRAVDLQKLQIENIRANYNAPSFDFENYENNKDYKKINPSGLSLTLPDGRTATFKSKALMDAYKKHKGLK